jgi:hypothetical protein
MPAKSRHRVEIGDGFSIHNGDHQKVTAMMTGWGNARLL